MLQSREAGASINPSQGLSCAASKGNPGPGNRVGRIPAIIPVLSPASRQSTGQSVSQPFSHSVCYQSASHPGNLVVSQPSAQPFILLPASQPFSHPVSEPVSQSVSQSSRHPVREPLNSVQSSQLVSQSVCQTVTSAIQSVNHSARKPICKSVGQPASTDSRCQIAVS